MIRRFRSERLGWGGFWSFVLLSVSARAFAEESPLPPPKADDRAVYALTKLKEARSQLVSGKCKITGTVNTTYLKEPKGEIAGPVTILMAFDYGGNRIRFDLSRPGWVVDYSTLQTLSTNQGAASAKQKIGTLTKKFADDGERVSFWHSDNVLCSVSPNINADLRATSEYFDLRAAGLHEPHTFKGNKPFEAIFDEALALTKFSRTIEAGEQRWIIERSAETPLNRMKWILELDPNKAFAPIRHRLENTLLKKDPPETIVSWEFNVDWDQREGVWVPLRYRQLATNESYIESFDYAFEWLEVNQPQPKERFSYVDFNLPDYVGIIDTTSGESIYLKEPKPHPDTPQPLIYQQPESRSGLRILMIAFTIVLPVSYLLLRWFRGRPTTTT